MNHTVTSKEKILETSRNMIKENGYNSISIRAVASAAGISIGSVYNYFSSKVDLVGATIESIWCEIFGTMKDYDSFTDCIEWIYERIEFGNKMYPGFFNLHSMAFLQDENLEGRKLMKRSLKHIKNKLCSILLKDKSVREGCFDDEFTPEKYIEFVFSNIMASMMRDDYDYSVLIEIIKRTIYNK